MESPSSLDVLKSSRFQALVLIAIFYYLSSVQIISQEIFDAALIIFGGHIGIRTIDRTADAVATK